ncbi:hypothetical protein EBQ81_00845, partial [bacterium]|nr:hypothetical protein [bacterium]
MTQKPGTAPAADQMPKRPFSTERNTPASPERPSTRPIRNIESLKMNDVPRAPTSRALARRLELLNQAEQTANIVIDDPTPEERTFVDALVQGHSMAEAYRKAYPERAASHSMKDHAYLAQSVADRTSV